MVVPEGDRPAVVRDADVPAAGGAPGPVVLRPGAVEGRLEPVAAGRQGGGQLPDQVRGVQGQLGRVTVRHPVARAAELRVHVAGGRDSPRLLRGVSGAEQVGAVVVAEGDRAAGVAQRDVVAVQGSAGTVVLGPTIR